MNKLCICIPTYNRENKMQMVLQKEIDFLYQKGIDVHIFDSSETEKTRKLIAEYGSYKNLYYHAVDHNIGSNEKVFYIYQEFAKKYKYIWIIHDHTVFSEKALCYLLEQLDDSISYYFLQMQFHTFAWEDVTDLEQLLYETAWLSGRFGTVILNSTLFLENVNWEYFRCKYLNKKMKNYSHIGFYFERASQIKNFKARIIRFPRDMFFDISNHQKIGWYHDLIRICLECWGEVILNLPECYTNKLAVLQTQDKWFLSTYSLITYKKNKVYDVEKYWKYQKWIKLIRPEENKNAFWISLLPASVSCRIYTRKLISKVKRTYREGGKVCIYGAGRHGIECMDYLEACGMGIDAFLVTKKEGNPEKIKEYPVYQAEDYVKDKEVFVVIAIMSDKIGEIKTYLDSLKKNSSIQYIEFI